MNNRKPRNRRGKITRREYEQIIPEAKFVTEKGKRVNNPAYPGTRRGIHHQTPKIKP